MVELLELLLEDDDEDVLRGETREVLLLDDEDELLLSLGANEGL